MDSSQLSNTTVNPPDSFAGRGNLTVEPARTQLSSKTTGLDTKLMFRNKMSGRSLSEKNEEHAKKNCGRIPRG